MAFEQYNAAESVTSICKAGANLTLKATVGIGFLHHRLVSGESDDVQERLQTSTSGQAQIGALSLRLNDRYEVVRVIGEGTFSQLVEAEDRYSSGKRVAVKIINAGCDYIGEEEVRVISALNRTDEHDQSHIVRMSRAFRCGNHCCIVLELLGPSLVALLEVLSSASVTAAPLPLSQARSGLSLQQVRKIGFQALFALMRVRKCGYIHADIKPENFVLIQSIDLERVSTRLKLIDFGNAFLLESRSLYFEDFELQSMFYRAPEIVLGDRTFDYAIDMWSLGCVLAELYFGRPLFRVQSSRDLPFKWQQVLGQFPWSKFNRGKFASRFTRDPRYEPCNVPQISHAQALHHFQNALGCQRGELPFIQLLRGLLQYDPQRRLTPFEALRHPFFASLVDFDLFISQRPAPEAIQTGRKRKRLELSSAGVAAATAYAKIPPSQMLTMPARASLPIPLERTTGRTQAPNIPEGSDDDIVFL